MGFSFKDLYIKSHTDIIVFNPYIFTVILEFNYVLLGGLLSFIIESRKVFSYLGGKLCKGPCISRGRYQAFTQEFLGGLARNKDGEGGEGDDEEEY